MLSDCVGVSGWVGGGCVCGCVCGGGDVAVGYVTPVSRLELKMRRDVGREASSTRRSGRGYSTTIPSKCCRRGCSYYNTPKTVIL